MLILVASMALAGGAAAQSVYKYKDAQGVTVYTDNPRSGNGKAHAVEGDQLSIAPAESSTAGADRQFLKDAQTRSAALDRATDDIVAASRALREAEDKRDLGVEPLEGERQGRRFRPEYWQRQQQLQSAVSAAQAKLDEALARRNAVR